MNRFKDLSLFFMGLFLFIGCPQPESGPTTPSTKSDYTSSNIGILKAVVGGTFNNGTADMTVSTFRMSQFEITRAQFLAILGTDPSDDDSSSGTSDPVRFTNWYHALAFCNKLSQIENLTPVYTIQVDGTPVDWDALTYSDIPIANDTDWNAAIADWSASGYRLPTEAEWEYAARGGQGTFCYTYAGSNTIGEVAVVGSYRTEPVGSKAPNELGLYDMSGNIFEWCWDWYSNLYPDTDHIDYHGPDLGSNGISRVVRGGSWDFPIANCRVSERSYVNQDRQDVSFGFRVARN